MKKNFLLVLLFLIWQIVPLNSMENYYGTPYNQPHNRGGFRPYAGYPTNNTAQNPFMAHPQPSPFRSNNNYNTAQNPFMVQPQPSPFRSNNNYNAMYNPYMVQPQPSPFRNNNNYNAIPLNCNRPSFGTDIDQLDEFKANLNHINNLLNNLRPYVDSIDSNKVMENRQQYHRQIDSNNYAPTFRVQLPSQTALQKKVEKVTHENSGTASSSYEDSESVNSTSENSGSANSYSEDSESTDEHRFKNLNHQNFRKQYTSSSNSSSSDTEDSLTSLNHSTLIIPSSDESSSSRSSYADDSSLSSSSSSSSGNSHNFNLTKFVKEFEENLRKEKLEGEERLKKYDKIWQKYSRSEEHAKNVYRQQEFNKMIEEEKRIENSKNKTKPQQLKILNDRDYKPSQTNKSMTKPANTSKTQNPILYPNVENKDIRNKDIEEIARKYNAQIAAAQQKERQQNLHCQNLHNELMRTPYASGAWSSKKKELDTQYAIQNRMKFEVQGLIEEKNNALKNSW